MKMEMPKFSGPDDVYHALVDQAGESWLIGLLTFAMLEERRIEWSRHRFETVGATPTPAETLVWYESQPPGALGRAREEADAALNQYVLHAVAEFDEKYRREIADGTVVAEVRKLGRWAPQLGMNVLGGVIGSIVFTALLMIVAAFVLNEPSPNDMVKALKQPTEEAESGSVGDHD